MMSAALLPSLAWAQAPAGLPAPPNGFDMPKSGVAKGMVTTITYQAKGTAMPARVYTPPGYSDAQKYPTLYLLHGIGGDENEWFDQGEPDVILDNLIGAKTAKPMVMVLPRGFTGAKGSGDFAAFESVLLESLIPHIEANYSVIKAQNARALAGLSMGGGQTLKFGFGHVDVFGSLGIFSPAPNSPNPPASAFTNLAAAKTDLKAVYLSCGTDEQPYRGTCENYHAYMNEQDIEHVFQLETGLVHNFVNWKRGLYNFSQRIFQDVIPGGGGSGGAGGGGGQAGSGGQAAGGQATGGAGGSGLGGTGGTAGGAGGAIPSAGVGGSGGPNTAGTTSASGAPGSAGATSGGSGSTPAAPTSPTADAGGCDCNMTRTALTWPYGAAFALAALRALRSRRRR